jgi:hypothetical protein
MSVNFIYDALNDFGELTAAGDFPNTFDMGEASLERMTIDLKLPMGAVSGAVTLSLRGSDTEGGTYETIVTGGSVSAATLNSEGYALPVPKTKYRFLKASLSGSFTGTVRALVNSYLGK